MNATDFIAQYEREKEAQRQAHAAFIAEPSDEAFFLAAKSFGRLELAIEQYQAHVIAPLPAFDMEAIS